MYDLREKIAQRIEKRFYMFCKDKTIARHAACDVLDLPELKSTIEKAEGVEKLEKRISDLNELYIIALDEIIKLKKEIEEVKK